MYCITDQQVEYILNDIRRNGVEMEDLQLNLLDHICCKVEHEFKENDDFERFYQQVKKQLCFNNLAEIEQETINLLTYKNYYVMKKAMMISGAISAIALIFGSFFKVMWWPGASALLTLGVGALGLVFLPLMALFKSKEAISTGGKTTTILGGIMGLLFCFAVLAAVQHWPGSRSGAYWLTAIGFSLFVFVPVFFFNGIRVPERRVNTIVITILVVGFSCLQFTMIGIRMPVQQLPIYTYLNNEQILHTLQQKAGAATPGNQKLITSINSDCDQLKTIILEHDMNLSSIPADFEEKNMNLREQLVDFRQTSKAWQLLTDLKASITTYNATAGNTKIPIEHTIINLTPEQLARTTNIFALNSLSQLQMNLAMASQEKVAVK